MSSRYGNRQEILRRAALRALRAPSIHNTQPWRFVLTAAAVEIRADRRRQLGVLDPRGRQLLISCGCALQHARIALEAAGHRPVVQRFPDAHDPDLVARVEIGEPACVAESAALDRAIDDRRTNRRSFLSEPLPAPLVRELQALAGRDGAQVVVVDSPEHRDAVIRLSAQAEGIERSDQEYLAELNRWFTDDPRRPDGVQAASVPHSGGSAWASDPVTTAARGFDVRDSGWLPPAGPVGAESLLLFCSRADTPGDWLRVGEALERVWLTLTDRGYWANPVTQLIEVRSVRDDLLAALQLRAHPQILLRVGKAPAVLPSNRRTPADVITVSEGS